MSAPRPPSRSRPLAADAADEGPRPQAAPTARGPQGSGQTESWDRVLVGLLASRGAAARDASTLPAEAPPPGPATARRIEELLRGYRGLLPAESVAAILREFYSGLRAVVRPRRVAYLGPPQTYSYLAATAYFGHAVELAPVGSIAAVFEEVERDQADFGVVPIENSTDGRVADALHCLARSDVQICGEAPLRIRHCLLGLGPRDQVVRVCSKPQALSQCRHWLARHLPAAALVETASTAAAAEMASGDARVAAIASAEAAASHGLQVLARNIEDNPDNITRFAVIGRQAAAKTGDDKTAVVFETPHEPGALADAMAVFKRSKLNLTWIESFPAPGQRGRYLFFVEFQGHASDLRVRRALAALGRKALRITLLGSYAQAAAIG